MKLKEIVLERWKFYLPVYILGYVISLVDTGVPNLLYLSPLNLFALVLSIVIGNALYHTSKKMPTYRIPFKAMKYILISSILMICFNIVRILLIKIGIDITPLIGIR